MDLGKLGVWYFFDGVTTDVATEAAQRIESLGYGTLGCETVGKDPLTTASWFLANTKTLNMATGIVNIYNREPGVMLAAQRTLAEQSRRPLRAGNGRIPQTASRGRTRLGVRPTGRHHAQLP